jgi:hypothetical protein
MRIGLLVLTFFAATWASAGLLVSGATPGLILIPIAVSLALLAWGWRGSGLVGSSRPNVGKLVGLWSAIEGVAIFVAVNVLENQHRDDLMFPVIVIIVGLHFLPLARGLPRTSYYASGAALVFTGLAALLLPAEQRPIAVGMCAALILWATSVPLILGARRSARTSAARVSDAIPPLG